MPDRDLRLEALSAIVGCPVKSLQEFKKKNPGEPKPPVLQPQDVVDIATGAKCLEDYLSKVNKPGETTSSEKNEISILTIQMEAMRTLLSSKPQDEVVQKDSTEAKVLIEGTDTTTAKAPTAVKTPAGANIPNEARAIRKELFVNEEDFFDPIWDYDFTYITDGDVKFKRGGEQYSRPCGWRRFALKVLGKYKDGDGWLGMGADAWPVSYHGTSIDGAKGIIQTHYIAGPGQVHGRGIYSTPNIDSALIYSHAFTSKATKKTYEVILQNKINPKNRSCFHDYWLVPVPERTPADEEKLISERSIRPYGLLLREVKDKTSLKS